MWKNLWPRDNKVLYAVFVVEHNATQKKGDTSTVQLYHPTNQPATVYSTLAWDGGRFSLSTLVLSFCSRTGGPAPHCHHLKRKLTNSIVSAAPPCLVSGSVCTRHTPATPFGFLPRNVSVPWVVRILRQRGFGRGHMW